jgi:hypothetical protein
MTMKSGIIMQDLPEEFFVVRVDGHVKSSYRRFVDALRAGLSLKDQFPGHDIKVLSTANHLTTAKNQLH